MLEQQLQEKPRLYDVYLGSHGESWHELMVRQGLDLIFRIAHAEQPLSIYPVGPSPLNSPKHTSLDVNAPLASVLSTIAFMISMPCPDLPSRTALPPESSNDNDPEDEDLPYLEIGIMDVEIPRGNPQISQ